MNYEEALKYLQDLTRFGYNFGLGRIAELLRRFDDPHQKLSVVHVGGTNGKGSTCAMVQSMLRASGYSAGMFTSPHISTYTERFNINGAFIPGQDMADLIAEMKPFLSDMTTGGFEHPTEFEVETALAFIYFYRQKVDFLVLEVGLGGLIDSTNVVVPEVAVITNVGMDHMEYLGHSVREIAQVKAGIIKEGIPLVTAARGEALEVIRQVSSGKNAPLTLVGRDVTWQETGRSLMGQNLDIYGLDGEYKDVFLPLVGRHQQVNAATAVAAAELLARRKGIRQLCVKEGLEAVRWPARFEVVRNSPTVIIDVAHNYDGALSLARTLGEYLPGRKVVLVAGMLADKEKARVMSVLAPMASAVVVTRPESGRAGDWKDLAGEAARYVDRVETIESIGDALKRGVELAGESGVVLVAGSFYLIAGSIAAL